MKPERSVVLGFKPYAAGFAWIAFESPFSIHDKGSADARGEKNARCLAMLERVLERVQPDLMVLEAFEGPGIRQSARIKRLCRAAVVLARNKGVDVVWLTRGDVQAAFVAFGAKHRYEIACAVAHTFAELREKLPPKRRVWESVPRGMALFDAAAVVLAHYQLSASELFNDLRTQLPDDAEMDKEGA